MNIKKLLFTLILLIPFFTVTSCSNGENNSSQHNEDLKPKKFDLSGFTSNLPSATYVGIKSKPVQQKKNLALGETEINKNTVVINKNNKEEEMKFKKIVPDTRKSEITDVSEIIATEYGFNEETEEIIAGISFKTIQDFNYSLYYNKDDSSPIPGYENITDGSESDLNEKEKFVTVHGLELGHTYYLHSKGRGSIVEILQRDFDYEIMKLYVQNGLTFVCFCKDYIRDSTGQDRINYLDEEKYISFYDKRNYNTYGEDYLSYIIDNKTGLIYPIKDFTVFDFQNGLVNIIKDEKATKKILCDITINDKDELEITQLFTNPNIEPIFAFKDKYNNKFVYNFSYNGYDEKLNTTYFTRFSDYYYYLTQSNETIRIKNCSTNYFPKGFIKVLNHKNEFVDIDMETNYRIKYSTLENMENGFYPVAIKDNYVYLNGCKENKYTSLSGKFGRVNLTTNNFENVPDILSSQLTKPGDVKVFQAFMVEGIVLLYENKNLYAMEDIYSNLNEMYNNKRLIIEDCFIDDYHDIIKVDVNGSIKYFFDIMFDENNIPHIDISQNGGFDDLSSIVFQPIN